VETVTGVLAVTSAVSLVLTVAEGSGLTAVVSGALLVVTLVVAVVTLLAVTLVVSVVTLLLIVLEDSASLVLVAGVITVLVATVLVVSVVTAVVTGAASLTVGSFVVTLLVPVSVWDRTHCCETSPINSAVIRIFDFIYF
jgi:hypothetical protein